MSWITKTWRRRAYEKVPLSSNDDLPATETSPTARTSNRFSWTIITLINLLLTAVTIAVAIFPGKAQKYVGLDALTEQSCRCSTAHVDSRYKTPGLNADLKRVSGYSPLLDEVDLTPSPKVLNGAFHDNSTIFMQDPSPEVDEAWELFSGDIFLTSWPTVRDSGRSLSKSIHFPPSPDGEPGKYLATWDVFHQIHCLNWLRKATNWEYYYGDHKPGPVYSSHQKHCIHMLLQSLMCHADVDMITFEWMEGHDHRVDNLGVEDKDPNHEPEEHSTRYHPKKRNLAPKTKTNNPNQAAIPAANFHVHKQCRNFSALVEWAKENREEDPSETRRRLTVPGDVNLIRWEDY